MSEIAIIFLVAAVIAAASTAVAVRYLIPKLKSIKLGQKILEIGPRWHKSKEGTPTMGGIAFLGAAFICSLTVGTALIFRGDAGQGGAARLITVILFAFANGLIGLCDDYVKFIRKRNEGLAAWQKMLCQMVAGAAFLAAATRTGLVTTVLEIPFFRVSFDLGFFYYPLALLFIAWVVNSVNLTDGIDGLASSVTLIVGVYFAAEAFRAASVSGAFLAAVTVGVCGGFLTYNFYPARIFMGDTGSLFLGGLVSGLAFMLGSPLVIVTAGIIYMIENISVVMQVGYFKLTHGKRIFLMTPLHHHFERLGWSELRIVGVSCVVTAAACALTYIFA